MFLSVSQVTPSAQQKLEEMAKEISNSFGESIAYGTPFVMETEVVGFLQRAFEMGHTDGCRDTIQHLPDRDEIRAEALEEAYHIAVNELSFMAAPGLTPREGDMAARVCVGIAKKIYALKTAPQGEEKL